MATIFVCDHARALVCAHVFLPLARAHTFACIYTLFGDAAQVALLALLDERLRLRELDNRVSILETEVADLRDEAAKIGDRRVLYESRDAIESVIARERSACDELRGSMRLARENRRANEKALGADDFVDIDARVERQLVELRTNEMSVVDLKGYAVALDKALQSLHAQKMAEINRIIRELWQRVYRNSDIDVRHRSPFCVCVTACVCRFPRNSKTVRARPFSLIS